MFIFQLINFFIASTFLNVVGLCFV